MKTILKGGLPGGLFRSCCGSADCVDGNASATPGNPSAAARVEAPTKRSRRFTVALDPGSFTNEAPFISLRLIAFRFDSILRRTRDLSALYCGRKLRVCIMMRVREFC